MPTKRSSPRPGRAAKQISRPRRSAGKKSPRVAARGSAAGPRPTTEAPQREERRRRFPEALRLRGISPALTVDDLAKSLEFYVGGLGFTIKDRWEREGKLSGVMLVAGRCEIGLSQDDWAKGRDRVKGVGISLYAETGQSLELIAALAKEHGIVPDGPKLAPWGDRILEFRDPDGYKLTLFWPKR